MEWTEMTPLGGRAPLKRWSLSDPTASGDPNFQANTTECAATFSRRLMV